MVARNGDWIFIPYQCETCWFLNMFNTKPIPRRQDDKRMLSLIKRVNFDMFGSREASTVQGNLSKVKVIVERLEGRKGFIPLSEFTEWKVEDMLGMGIAITMLEKSLEKGRLSYYMQFDSCWTLRSAASNVYMASYEGMSFILWTIQCRELSWRDLLRE